MCTVVVDVPDRGPIRLLAVRDEDPGRAWDGLGAWWPETYPGVRGVRDRRAGGAWLAAAPERGRLAVLLNRADQVDLPESELLSRGGLALESVAGRPPRGEPRTHGFNLFEADGAGARVTAWDGRRLRTTPLAPGTHMIAHDDVDDAGTARIARWLPEFRAARPAGEGWWREWGEVLAASGALDPADDRAIIRDNRPHGYPTLSLLYCLAEVSADGVELRQAILAEPGVWGEGTASA